MRKLYVQPRQNVIVRVRRQCPRQGESGSSPQMVERRDTHYHVHPCVHGEALLFGTSEKRAAHFLATAKSSCLFDGPWAWLFLADRTVWGSVRQTRSSGLDGFLSRLSRPSVNEQRNLWPVPGGMDRNLWRLVTTSAQFAELQHGLDLSNKRIWSRNWKATEDTRVPGAYKLV